MLYGLPAVLFLSFVSFSSTLHFMRCSLPAVLFHSFVSLSPAHVLPGVLSLSFVSSSPTLYAACVAEADQCVKIMLTRLVVANVAYAALKAGTFRR